MSPHKTRAAPEGQRRGSDCRQRKNEKVDCEEATQRREKTNLTWRMVKFMAPYWSMGEDCKRRAEQPLSPPGMGTEQRK
jgi:hypothetical protein